jgi:hypothetical protein
VIGAPMADYNVQQCVCHKNVIGDLCVRFCTDCTIEERNVLAPAVFG